MEYAEDVRELILARLMEGESLVSVCKSEGMPNRSTVQRWQNDDADFDAAVTHAREEGFQLLADEARRKAHTAVDAVKGRLAFDADRWYLGKLSNAFSDNKPQKHDLTGKIYHGIEIELVRQRQAEG